MTWKTCFIIGAVFCTTLPLHAEDAKNLKGAMEFLQLRPECSYLAPHEALALTRQGKLLNDFQYGEDGHPITRLIQSSFNIPPGSENPEFFQFNPLARNFSRFVAPSVAGIILNVLAQSDPSRPLDITHLQGLIENDAGFKARLEQAGQDREDALGKLRAYEDSNEVSKALKLAEEKLRGSSSKRTEKGKVGQAEDCQREESGSPLEGAGQETLKICKEVSSDPGSSEGLKRQIAELKVQINIDPEGRRLRGAVDRVTYDKKYLRNFLNRLSEAFHSEKESVGRYPRHTVEQVVLSLGWLNTGDSKRDLIALYSPLDHCLSERGKHNLYGIDPDSSQRRENWTRDLFTAADYKAGVEHLAGLSSNQERAMYLRSHPEELALMSYLRASMDHSALPTLSFKSTRFTHPQTKNEVSMPDCMEYAILSSILNPLAGGPGNRFEVEGLEKKLRSEGYEMHPGLKAFLSKYPDPSKVNELEAHRMWAELVTSIPGLAFVRNNPKYEIDTRLSNALIVFKHLLYAHELAGVEAGTARDKTKPWDNLTRSKKLDRVFQLLSRDDREVDWTFQGGTKEDLNRSSIDTDLTLEFTLNDSPKYDWRINSGHSEVNPKGKNSTDWREGLGPEMAKMLVQRSEPGSGSMTVQDRSGIGWLLGARDAAKTFRQLKSHPNDPHFEDLLWRRPLESVDQKLDAIGLLSEKLSRTQKEPSGKFTRELIKRLHSKIPPDDRVAQQKYQATLADHHYPYTEDETKTDTGAKFTLVEAHPLLGKGRFWKYESLQGGSHSSLLWGETAKLNDGRRRDNLMRWSEANDYCLEFNKDETAKSQVRKALSKINEDQELAQLREQYYYSDRPDFFKIFLQKYVELKKLHAIQGCFLPPMEEFMMLRADLGYQDDESGFLPRFLPELNNGWFWSSSGHHFNPSGLFFFKGDNGRFGSDRDSPGSVWAVRCVCTIP